ncbi:MAG: T9SS type A sorting domain-containing protein [Bacteroidia bacterium]|nr:T9SS type A sorting domain-containing protein [Bacteroidia bacterium]MCO5252926.1 T9SS type A sorting domain-containing protein [Bacteroidota bacterium]
MKNLIQTSILSFFAMFMLNAQGQWMEVRYIDLGTNCISPLPNSYFTTPAHFEVKFSIVNYGPDTIIPEDSVRIYMDFKTANGIYNGDFGYVYPCNISILPGDSIVLTKTISIDSILFFDNDFHLSCEAWLRNRSINIHRPYIGEIAGDPKTNRENNFWYRKMKHRSIISSIEFINNSSQDFNYYPNPVNDMLTIQYNNISRTPQRIELIDINGRCMYSQPILRAEHITDRAIQINIPAYLQNGIYLLKLYVNDVPTWQKIIIQR